MQRTHCNHNYAVYFYVNKVGGFFFLILLSLAPDWSGGQKVIDVFSRTFFNA